MKTNLIKKSIWQSLLSLLIMGIFIFISMGSLEELFGPAAPKVVWDNLGNGVMKQTTYYDVSITEATGKLDKYGRWDGLVTIINLDFPNKATEEVNMVSGKRHGKSKTTVSPEIPGEDPKISYNCYNMGVKIECEKAAHISSANSSAFEVLGYKYPWFLVTLNAFSFNDKYVETYLDTMETLMSKNEFLESEFNAFYQNALDSLNGTVYDSIINMNSKLSIIQGLDLLKNSEFRLAVIDGYWSDDHSTYNNVNTTYPNYLLSLNDAGVNNQDFGLFCHAFDSLLVSYGTLDTADPFFLDSLDNRMYRALELIASAEKSASLASLSLKSAILLNVNKKIGIMWNKINPQLTQLLSSSPKDVASIILSFMLVQISEADILKKAVTEAWYNKKGVIRLPTVTTEFSDHTSSTSVTLIGNVLENGGADVTTRGIVWGTYYNPTIIDHLETEGMGNGSFLTTITGLSSGATYYARAFATNSVGTAYGNCFSFTATSSTGTKNDKISALDFKIYPNPTSAITTFRFQLESSEIIHIKILNLNGQVVINKDMGHLPKGENQIQLNLYNLENGIYNCQITSDKTVKVAAKLLIFH